MRRVSLSLCPSFLQMLSSISLCCWLSTTLTMHFFIMGSRFAMSNKYGFSKIKTCFYKGDDAV